MGDENTIRVDGETISLGLTAGMRAIGAALTPLQRPGTAEEAAGPVFSLCSPWSDYVHGQVVTVSGGQQAGMMG
jgi:3-oxoacyl-[acyl-carrier protein] reductase